MKVVTVISKPPLLGAEEVDEPRVTGSISFGHPKKKRGICKKNAAGN